MAFPQNSHLLSHQAAFVSAGYMLCLVRAGSSSGPKDLSPSPVPQVSCAPEAGQKEQITIEVIRSNLELRVLHSKEENLHGCTRESGTERGMSQSPLPPTWEFEENNLIERQIL